MFVEFKTKNSTYHVDAKGRFLWSDNPDTPISVMGARLITGLEAGEGATFATITASTWMTSTVQTVAVKMGTHPSLKARKMEFSS